MPKKNDKTEKHSTNKSANNTKSHQQANQTPNNQENMNDCKGGASNSIKNHSAENKSAPNDYK